MNHPLSLGSITTLMVDEVSEADSLSYIRLEQLHTKNRSLFSRRIYLYSKSLSKNITSVSSSNLAIL